MKNICYMMFIFLFVLTACNNEEETRFAQHHASSDVSISEKEQIITKQRITLSAIGDMLIHDGVYHDAQTANGYDFKPMLELVKPYLEETTLSIANQETMIGGAEIGLSSYPSFNSPYEVGDALKDAGVDIVSIANNHTLDRGEKAIQNAIAHWNAIDMVYTGAYQSDQDSEQLRIVEKEGMRVAFLSYTYGTNGIPVPAGKDYLVNLIDPVKMKADIAEAEEQADVTVVSMHFGAEYQRLPNESQKELAQVIADAGGDVVIGHHPHVLQPMEMLKGKNGNETFVVYSLGNFLSSQNELYRRLGGILQIEIEKVSGPVDEVVSIKNPKFIPTFVYYERHRNYKVVPMHQLEPGMLANGEKLHEEIKQHMSQWMPELKFP
ncbi:CapA family protein [Thalassobacillus hwangdonensis]|uniref:CapA family protein n=1 Tax=Thalassobacillus hwangdonensis TaxID=546108 RepID=A0ABW3L192_9BACI